MADRGLLAKLMANYQGLRGLGVNLVDTRGDASSAGDPRKLEFWPPGETGDRQYPRPQGLPVGEPGVQTISPDVTARDVAADITSHWLVNQDPRMNEIYRQFAGTFDTPAMQPRLQQDYQWSQANEGEQRPFDQWLGTTRIPDYMRGYMFDQWPAKARGMYSPDQIDLMNQMGSYLHGHGAGGYR